MTLQEAIEARHSVRAYKNEPLAANVVKVLEEQMAMLNREGNLHMQLILKVVIMHLLLCLNYYVRFLLQKVKDLKGYVL